MDRETSVPRCSGLTMPRECRSAQSGHSTFAGHFTGHSELPRKRLPRIRRPVPTLSRWVPRDSPLHPWGRTRACATLVCLTSPPTFRPRHRKAHPLPRRQTSAPCSGFARPAPRGRNLDASVPRPCAPSPTPTGGSPSPSPSPPLTRTRCFEEATPSAPPIRSPCLVCTRPSSTSPATGGSSASFARRAPPAARTRNGAPHTAPKNRLVPAGGHSPRLTLTATATPVTTAGMTRCLV